MEENNKRLARPDDKKSVPKDKKETQNQVEPLSLPWSTSTQAYHNFGSTSTSSVNPAGSQFYSSWLGNQIWNRPTQTQYGSVYQRRPFSNFYPMAAAGVGQSSLLGSADRIQMTYAENNKNVVNTVNNSIKSTSKVNQESTKNGKRPSIPETNGEELTRSAASESMETTAVGHNVKNVGVSTKFTIKDLPSIKKLRSSKMIENGRGAQNMTSNENCNADLQNRNIASDHFEANPTQLNQKLSTDPNESGNNPQLEKKESEEEKAQRKKLAKKISSKKSRMKMKIKYEKLIDSIESLDVENAALKKQIQDRSNVCERVTEEKNSLLEELIAKYGKETIMNILNAQPTDSVAGGGGQGSNNS